MLLGTVLCANIWVVCDVCNTVMAMAVEDEEGGGLTDRPPVPSDGLSRSALVHHFLRYDTIRYDTMRPWQNWSGKVQSYVRIWHSYDLDDVIKSGTEKEQPVIFCASQTTIKEEDCLADSSFGNDVGVGLD